MLSKTAIAVEWGACMADMITYDELLRRLRDPDINDVEIAPYMVVVAGEGGFDFVVKPNPETVTMTAADQELENALSIGNGISRLRRRIKFFKNLEKHPERPVLVEEGDSWHQFPFLIDDVIDQISHVYNVWSLSGAGATMHDMVHGDPGKGGFEFLAELRRHRSKVKAFLFSGAGNDIIGDDVKTGRPMLEGLLNDFNGDANDVLGHVNSAELNARIAELTLGYSGIVRIIRNEPGLEELPIVFHGYDYAFPFPFDDKDERAPSYAKNDQWLGRAFAARNISNDELRRNIVKLLIDRLYKMLFELRDLPGQSGVYIVDCRGAMPNLSDWNDEIHGTSAGFFEVGQRFKAVLQGALN